MATATDQALEIVERFLQMVRNGGIKIERAILFGSFVRGQSGEWSDIDLAIVSPDFCGIPFYDRKKLTPFLLKVDSRLELHPFKPEDFTEDNDFVEEIIKSGLELKLN